MPNPWETYQAQPPKSDSTAPWEKYAQPKDEPKGIASEAAKGFLDDAMDTVTGTAKALIPKSLQGLDYSNGVSGFVKSAQDAAHKPVQDVKDSIGAGHYFEAAKKAARATLDNMPGGQMVTGLIDTSIDQAQKAHEDFTRGEYARSALHAGASAIPFAAGGVDAALGSEAKFDKYGNVIQESVEPNPGRALGKAAFLATTVAAPKAAERLTPKTPTSITVTPTITPELTPEESAAVDFADKRGIPIPTSVRTGSKAAANVESYLSNAPGSAGVMKKAAMATRDAVQRVGADLVEQPGAGKSNYPAVASPEIAGEAVQEGQQARNVAIDEGKAQLDAATRAKGADLAADVHPTPATEESSGSGVASDLKKDADTHATGAREAYGRLREAEAKPENIKTVPIGEGKIPHSVQAELDAVSQSLANKKFADLTDSEKKSVTETAKKLGIDPTPQPETAKMAFPVQMKTAKASLTPILEQLTQEPADVLNRSRALPAIKAIVNGPDFVPASVAEDFLSGAKAIAREGVNAKTRFLAKQAIDAVQPLVDDAVSTGGKDAIDSLNEGRALTKAKYATLDTIDQLPTEPVKIYRKLAAPGDTNINLLRDVKTKAPASIPAVARATFQGLLEDGQSGGAEKALNEWNKIGPSTKLELFGDQSKVDTIDRYFKTAHETSLLDSAPGMESPTGKLPASAVDTYNKLTRDKDAAIGALREAANVSPDAIPVVARAKVQELIEAATAPEGTRPGPDAAFSAWNKLGPETKRTLYPDPKVRADITDFLNTAKRAVNALDRNSSKTAYVNEAAHAVQVMKKGAIALVTGGAVGAVTGDSMLGALAGGATYSLGNYALAKILTTPGGAKLLTEGLKLSGDSAAVLARRAAITNRLLAIAGSDAKRIEEGSDSISTSHKEGDTVTLKSGDQVTIKKINQDGTFEY